MKATVLHSIGHPWCWWHPGPCHTGPWPETALCGGDDGTGNPGTGLCGWDFYRPWSPGWHHSSFGEVYPETGIFCPSWLSQWTWLEAACHWGCLGAPLQCPSLQCSRCHQHTSFKVWASLGQCWVQALQSTLFRGWPLQQRWWNPLLCLPVVYRRLIHIAEVGGPQTYLQQLCNSVWGESDPVPQHSVISQFVTDDSHCFVYQSVGEQGGYIKADEHLVFFNTYLPHHCHKVLGVPHMAVLSEGGDIRELLCWESW